MDKKWVVKNYYNGENPADLIYKVLKQRGIDNIEDFINPKSSSLIDWRLLSNIKEGLNLLHNHLQKKSQIGILVDSDFDGIASSTIITRYLRHFTTNITMIYHNKPKAHGFMDIDLETLKDFDLLILPDSLSSDYQAYEVLHNQGKDILLLDHHPQDKETKNAVTVNCTLGDYPNKMLSGGAVTWKFCMAYDETYDYDYAMDYVDLAACSIISDVMSVGTDALENRYICKLGFKNKINPAIKIIVGNYDFNSTAVSFSIANLVNACIREGFIKDVSEAFLSDNTVKVRNLITWLKSVKIKADLRIKNLVQEIIENQLKDIDLKTQKVLFVRINEPNVAGLVATKLTSLYNRSVIAVSDIPTTEKGEEYLIGSCRAFSEIPIKDYINKTEIGIAEGHPCAAGFKVKASEIELFKTKLDETMCDYHLGEMETNVDIEMPVDALNITFAHLIGDCNQITGRGFDKITVAIDDIKPITKFMIGRKHSCVNTNEIQFLKWNNIDLILGLEDGKSFDCIAEVEFNKKGKLPIKAIIRDYKISSILPFDL